MTKQSQLSKNRQKNPKKLSQIEYRLYIDFVNERFHGICQSGCGRNASDIHHAYYGAGGRDDRYITSICRECHHTIHHGTDIDNASRLKLLFKTIGKKNWKEYSTDV